MFPGNLAHPLCLSFVIKNGGKSLTFHVFQIINYINCDIVLWFAAHEKQETSRKRWGTFAAERKKGMAQSFKRKDGGTFSETILRARASLQLLSTNMVSSVSREIEIITTTCSSWSWKPKRNRSLYTVLSLCIAFTVSQVSQKTEFGIENWKGKGFSFANRT